MDYINNKLINYFQQEKSIFTNHICTSSTLQVMCFQHWLCCIIWKWIWILSCNSFIWLTEHYILQITLHNSKVDFSVNIWFYFIFFLFIICFLNIKKILTFLYLFFFQFWFDCFFVVESTMLFWQPLAYLCSFLQVWSDLTLSFSLVISKTICLSTRGQ